MDGLKKALPPLASLLPFEAAARLESFTRAADELHLTQTAISRQIRALEADLGISLFERRNRAVFLTPAGRALQRAVAGGLEAIAAGASELRRLPGRVVLSVELYLAIYWLMPKLSDFHRRHPDIDIEVLAGRRPLAENREPFDLALQCSGRASGPHERVFAVAEEIFPVCSPAYLEERGGPFTVQRLAGERLLAFAGEPGDWMDWPAWLKAVGGGGEPAAAARFDSYPVMIQAAVAGHGIALGWGRGLQALLEEGRLLRACAACLRLPQGLAVFRRQGSGPTREGDALLAWLREEALA